MPTKATAAISSEVATGRRMKGSERFICCSPRRLLRGDTRVTVASALQLVLPVSDDPLALAQAAGDDRDIAGGWADLDRPWFGGVVVR